MTKNIQITHETTMSAPEFRDAIDQAFSTLSEMYNLKGTWESDVLYSISGASVEGFVTLVGNHVEVSLTLGNLLVPFAGTIESMIATALKDRLK